MLGTERAVFLVQKVNIHIHVFVNLSHTSTSNLNFYYLLKKNPTSVPYNESHDYRSLSDILFTKDYFNIIFPYFFGTHISYFLIYSVSFAVSFD